MSNLLFLSDLTLQQQHSLNLRLDPSKEGLVAGLVATLVSLIVRRGPTHGYMRRLLFVSDRSCLDQGD